MSAAARIPLHERPLWQGFLFFLGPLVVSNVLQGLQGTINSIFLGRLLGVKALAAVSGFFPVLFIFIAFLIGFGNGAAVVVGQAYGARDHEKVQAVVGTTLVFGLITGAVVAVLGVLYSRTLLSLVGTPLDILEDTAAYGRVTLAAAPILFVFLLSTTLMRGVSDTMTPLLGLIVSIIVGLVATPAFILGWGGLPHLGIQSAAYAGILSWIVTLSWMAFHMRRVRHPLAPNASLRRHFRIDPQILKTVLRIGLPTGLQLVLLSIGEAIVLKLVNGFGSNATAAYGTVNQVSSYIQFPAFSISITASIFAAQAIGRGDIGRLKAITSTGLKLNLVMTGLLVIAGFLLSRTLIGFFFDDHEVTELAQHLFHIKLTSYLLFGAAGIWAGVMRASGTVLAPTIINIFSMMVMQVLTAYFLSKSMGIDGVWIGYPVASIFALVLQWSYFQFVWRKKTIEKLI